MIQQEVLKKLNLLLSQGMFELILPEKGSSQDIRLVYLMNDAAESFLVFRQARLTGTYQPDFQGEIWADLKEDGEKYVLVVRQEDSVCTLFFQTLELETHLYDYGKTGHFWVPGYEYLRQLEYRIAILRDKREYLGEEFCTEEESVLSDLAEFPPLNACCYPAVSEKYAAPACPRWQASREAMKVMLGLAKEAGDQSLWRWLKWYEKFPGKTIARHIGILLHRTAHSAVVDLLTDKLTRAAGVYEEREFPEAVAQIREIKEKAEIRKKELEQNGKKVEVLREEPFVYLKDSIEYKMYLMIWKTEGKNRKVEVETIQ